MTGRCISHREWKATQIFEADKISISNLNILANAGYDCWGRPKMQPIDITVTISLARDVSSAAAHDSVDDSTVHYGDLSKVIVARTKQHEGQWLSPDDFAQIILLAAIGSSPKPAAIAATQLTVHFPKSTLLGEGISLLLHHSPSLDITSPVLFLKNIRIPALIGVNAHERNQKQMVMISLWVDRLKTYVTDHSFEVEQIVVKVWHCPQHLCFAKGSFILLRDTSCKIRLQTRHRRIHCSNYFYANMTL